MTYLTEHLPFASSSSTSATGHGHPPPRSHLLVTDTLSSPAHFVLYHLMAAAALDKRKVVWVDFRAEGRASLESALKKAGMTIPKSLGVISPSSLPPTAPSSSSSGSGSIATTLYDEIGEPTLRPTYDVLAKELRSSGSSSSSSVTGTGTRAGAGAVVGAVVILDGLAELSWLGFEPSSIQRFVRAVLGLARSADAALVSILHADQLPLLASSPTTAWHTAEMQLFERLLRIANGWWRVSGLSSGRSGNVSGEISSHNLIPLVEAGGAMGKGLVPEIPRSRPLQYRLESNTVKLFAKGTGRGYL